jgi:hypothetical protein
LLFAIRYSQFEIAFAPLYAIIAPAKRTVLYGEKNRNARKQMGGVARASPRFIYYESRLSSQ